MRQLDIYLMDYLRLLHQHLKKEISHAVEAEVTGHPHGTSFGFYYVQSLCISSLPCGRGLHWNFVSLTTVGKMPMYLVKIMQKREIA